MKRSSTADRTVRCRRCKKSFVCVHPCVAKIRKFCSHHCAVDAKRKAPRVRKCLSCKEPFARPSWSRTRFCSKHCWYSWHQGSRHEQSAQVQFNCERCGRAASTNAYSYSQVRHHYCSQACARVEHGAKITGSKNPRWLGGGLETRGPTWPLVRARVIKKYGGRCARCGMTSAEHHQRYKKELHVHHKTPYRLNQNNRHRNLVPLCIPCHAQEEKDLRRRLTPAQCSQMKENLANKRHLGLDQSRDRRVPCPTCGKLKAPKSMTCRSCRTLEAKKRRALRMTCPQCGRRKGEHRERCRSCYFAERRSTALKILLCEDCGELCKYPGSTICWPCSARRNGRLTRGRGLLGRRDAA